VKRSLNSDFEPLLFWKDCILWKRKHHFDCHHQMSVRGGLPGLTPGLFSQTWGFLVNMEEAGERWFSSLVGHAGEVRWPEFSSWGGPLEFAFSRPCQTFGMGRSSACAEGDQCGLRHRGTWKWPSGEGPVWVSALYFGRFSSNFAFFYSWPFFLSSQRLLRTSLSI